MKVASYDLQTNPSESRQVLSFIWFPIAWLCVLAMPALIAAGIWLWFDSEQTEKDAAAHAANAEELLSASMRKGREIKALGEAKKLAERQSSWIEQTTRIQYVYDIIETALKGTKLSKCEVSWSEGRSQLNIELETIGSGAVIDSQLNNLSNTLSAKGFRSAAIDQPKIATGIRFRGTFIATSQGGAQK